MQQFDVVQSTNIAGNLLASWPASWHAMEPPELGRTPLPHLSANGRIVLAARKGVFYRLLRSARDRRVQSVDRHRGSGSRDRLWVNGKRLGIITNRSSRGAGDAAPRHRPTQAWVCGFLQSLNAPLKQMGMTFSQRLRAADELLALPVLLVNPVGSRWVCGVRQRRRRALPCGLPLGIVNVTAFS